eukprot:235135-Lingulodinium_polyedra.AAC.1
MPGRTPRGTHRGKHGTANQTLGGGTTSCQSLVEDMLMSFDFGGSFGQDDPGGSAGGLGGEKQGRYAD